VLKNLNCNVFKLIFHTVVRPGFQEAAKIVYLFCR